MEIQRKALRDNWKAPSSDYLHTISEFQIGLLQKPQCVLWTCSHPSNKVHCFVSFHEMFCRSIRQRVRRRASGIHVHGKPVSCTSATRGRVVYRQGQPVICTEDRLDGHAIPPPLKSEKSYAFSVSNDCRPQKMALFDYIVIQSFVWIVLYVGGFTSTWSCRQTTHPRQRREVVSFRNRFYTLHCSDVISSVFLFTCLNVKLATVYCLHCIVCLCIFIHISVYVRVADCWTSPCCVELSCEAISTWFADVGLVP